MYSIQHSNGFSLCQGVLNSPIYPYIWGIFHSDQYLNSHASNPAAKDSMAL